MYTGNSGNHLKLLQDESSYIISLHESVNFGTSEIVIKDWQVGEHLVDAVKNNVQQVLAECGDFIEFSDNVLLTDDKFKSSDQVNGIIDGSMSGVGPGPVNGNGLANS